MPKTNPMNKSIIEEFREKVNELKRDSGTEKEYDFGYKTIRRCADKQRIDEVFTVVDWGNIERFLLKALKSQRADIIKWVEKEIPKWMGTSVAHGEREETTVRCFLEHLKREL